MQKKQFFSVGIIALVLVASFLVLNGSATPEKSKPTCCKKSVKQCLEQTSPVTPVKADLEQFSHQFISLPVFSY
ncbi:MAG TPA: hypothetical protein VGO58_07885 [Chitinophagaceae bacterium]|jgi:hypothetical protein|nr:hypothetical protein [Chitinophagaceae bacterium]